MIINCGKTKEEHIEDGPIVDTCFVWLPKRVGKQRCVWLEQMKRTRTPKLQYKLGCFEVYEVLVWDVLYEEIK